MSRIQLSRVTLMNESRRTCAFEMLCIWLSHVGQKSRSFWAYKRAMPRIQMSHIVYINESCRTCASEIGHVARVHLRIRMSHIAHTNRSDRTCNRAMPHIQLSHVVHTNESCRTYAYVTSHIWTSRVSYVGGVTLLSTVTPIQYASTMTNEGVAAVSTLTVIHDFYVY